MRRIVLAVSFLLWAFMVGLVVRRHQAASASEWPGPLLALARSAPPAPVWYGLYRGGERAGRGRITADADAVGDALRRRIFMDAELSVPEPIAVHGEAEVLDPGGLSRFSLEVRAAAGLFLATGTVRGGELLLEWSGRPRGGAASPPGGEGFAGRAGLSLSGGWSAGTEVRDDGEEAVGVAGVITMARRYRVVTRAGEASVWIDADGGIVRAECPGGYGAIREPGAPREKAVR